MFHCVMQLQQLNATKKEAGESEAAAAGTGGGSDTNATMTPTQVCASKYATCHHCFAGSLIPHCNADLTLALRVLATNQIAMETKFGLVQKHVESSGVELQVYDIEMSFTV